MERGGTTRFCSVLLNQDGGLVCLYLMSVFLVIDGIIGILLIYLVDNHSVSILINIFVGCVVCEDLCKKWRFQVQSLPIELKHNIEPPSAF